MNLPTININDLPDLDIMVSALGSNIDKLSNAATDEIVVIVATYFWETGFTSSVFF